MRNFDQLDRYDWTQIQMGVNGCIGDDLSQWPHLQALFKKIGVDFLPLNTPYGMLKWVCEALYWQHRADQFAMKAAEHAQAAAKREKDAAAQEIYTQELFAENEKLRTDNENLKTALALEHDYAKAAGRAMQDVGRRP